MNIWIRWTALILPMWALLLSGCDTSFGSGGTLGGSGTGGGSDSTVSCGSQREAINQSSSDGTTSFPYRAAQLIVPTTNVTFTTLTVDVKRGSGGSSSFTFELYSYSSASNPEAGTILASSSETGVTTSLKTFTITTSEVGLVSGRSYWLVFRAGSPGIGPGGGIHLSTSSADPYSSGSAFTYIFGGGGWGSVSSGEYDLTFSLFDDCP